MTDEKQGPDVLVTNEFTIFMFSPVTDKARNWMNENIEGQWYGGSLVVEHRYGPDIAQALIEDGFIVE